MPILIHWKMSEQWQYVSFQGGQVVLLSAPLGSSENPIVVEDNDEEMHKHETCAICMEGIQNPKKLPCGHSYCSSCVASYFKHIMNTGYAAPWIRMKCPMCRARIPRTFCETIVIE